MDPLVNNPAYILFMAVAPLLIALVKQQGFSTQVNALIAFGCYIVLGVLGALTSGLAFTPENVLGFITVGTLIGTAAYNLVWTNLGSSGALPNGLDQRLTELTSVR